MEIEHSEREASEPTATAAAPPVGASVPASPDRSASIDELLSEFDTTTQKSSAPAAADNVPPEVSAYDAEMAETFSQLGLDALTQQEARIADLEGLQGQLQHLQQQKWTETADATAAEFIQAREQEYSDAGLPEGYFKDFYNSLALSDPQFLRVFADYVALKAFPELKEVRGDQFQQQFMARLDPNLPDRQKLELYLRYVTNVESAESDFRRYHNMKLKELHKRISSTRIDPAATEDRDAVVAAVRGSSSRAPEQPQVRLGHLTNAEARQHVRDTYGFDPGY